MFFGRVGRFETQLGSDFCAGGWRTGASDRVLDQFQNLLLAGGKLGSVKRGVVHGNFVVRRVVSNRGGLSTGTGEISDAVFLSSNCIFSQF